ncbi:hypothetical protein BS78_01G285900 [Paspalum vaginatum]|nr:hypothetical protein BS78_01G285900 [Paspalum vaginatum]
MMADAREDGMEACLTTALASSDGMAKLISSLPLETRCQPFHLRQLGGFWLPENFLPGAAAVHARFEPRPDDIFLASFPKSGTTWLNALAFATINRAEHPPANPGHPLRLQNPHDCVSFLEVPWAALTERSGGEEEDVFKVLPSPRVLATHLPYQLLPKRIRAESSGCRIVYVCRDPKDALVSGWLFTKRRWRPPRRQLATRFHRRSCWRRRSSCSAMATALAARSGSTSSGSGRRAGGGRIRCSSSGMRRCSRTQ